MFAMRPSDVLAGRWTIEETLGAGGQGSVHAAWDQHRQRRVALKVVAFRPQDVVDLKREFRLLSEVRHPNIVRALDLHIEGEIALVSMEYIDGKTLDRHLEPLRGTPLLAREIRLCCADVARALVALHARGISHRDVKPANILVRADGRAVLVDLGLARLATAVDADRGVSGTSGTVAYMPPEQFWALDASPAVDQFALGVSLFEAMSGALPWAPSPQRFSSDIRAPDLTSLTAIDNELASLVGRLIASEPLQRPSAADVLRLLTGGAQEVRGFGDFFGREVEIEAVTTSQRAASRGQRVMVVLGAAGVGKTALVERALDAVASPIVIRHRCHPHEKLPFQGVDGVVEGVLHRLHLTGRLRAGGELAPLVRSFPTLAGHLGMVLPTAASGVRAAPDVCEDVGTALANALGELGEEQPIVIWIEDLHWSDLDSVRVIASVAQKADLRVWWVLTARPSERTSFLLNIAIGKLPQDTLALSELSESSCHAWIAERRPQLAPTLRQELIQASGRWPFYLGELLQSAATHATTNLTDLLAQRIRSTSSAAQHALAAISLAAQPLGLDVLSALAPAPSAERVDELLDARLVAWVAPEEGPFSLVPCHDLVRQAVDAWIGDGAAAMHARLLEVLRGRATPGSLLHHARLAGLQDEARTLAWDAARQALDVHAYAAALEFLDTLRELDPSETEKLAHRSARATALAGLGRGLESGEAFLAAAERESDTTGRHRTLRLAVEQLMGAGAYERGRSVLNDLLDDFGVPRPRPGFRGLMTLLWLDRKVRRATPGLRPEALDADALERLELLWVAGAGVGLYDSVAAFQLQYRHAYFAATSGHPAHLALSLATQSLNKAWEGGAGRVAALGLLAEAERLAERSADPRAMAQVRLMRVVGLFLDREFRAALQAAEEGERWCLDRCPESGWHIASFRWFVAHTLGALGRLGRLQDILRNRIDAAEQRHDLFLLANLRVGRPILGWLAADRPDEALRALDWAESAAKGSPYFTYQAALGRVWTLLYQGDSAEAAAALAQRKRVLRKNFMLRFQLVRIETLELEALCALAMGSRAPGKDAARGAARARKIIATLERERVAWLAPNIARLRATAARLDPAGGGHASGAAAHEALAQCATGFAASDQELDAMLARFVIDRNAAPLRANGIVRPERFAAVWHPSGVTE